MFKKWITVALILCLPFIMVDVVDGKTVTLDPSSGSFGSDEEQVEFSGVKPNYQIELFAKNTHSYCNVSVTLYEKAFIGKEKIERIFLTPNEEGTITFIDTADWEGEYLISFISDINESAYMDQQTSVVVEYTIVVYDDRGNIVIDSEDPNKDEVIKEVEDESCGSIVIFGLVGLLSLVIITSLIKKRKNLR